MGEKNNLKMFASNDDDHIDIIHKQIEYYRAVFVRWVQKKLTTN